MEEVSLKNTETLQEFQSFIKKIDDCIVWIGRLNNKNLPVFKKRDVKSLVWEAQYNEPPQGYIFALCENRLCVNLEHLYSPNHDLKEDDPEKIVKYLTQFINPLENGCWSWLGRICQYSK